MIKLNNKNITYVALADSSNSLKAPKEIWYADSNNSVKLVYRRKDALIEGEDYEKYHWLVSTGAEWINTAVILDTNMGIYTIFAPLETDVFEHGIFGASSEPSDHNVLQIQRTYVGLYIPSEIITAYANVILNAVQDWSINLANDAKVYLNGAYVADTCPSSSSTVPYPIAIFSRNRNGQVSQSNCSMIKMNKFTIVKNSIPIITLIPCKLLKPVPKWLDANGIRRQVGECGMIDLVSGKFYGNVNSVGTFTVENYYERKEWLKGDGTAYIDTNIIVDVPSLKYSLEFIYDTNNIEFLCGSRDFTQHDSYSSAIIIDNVHNDMIRLDAISTASSNLLYGNIMPNVPNEVHIDCQTNSAIVNNSSIPGNRTIFNNSSNTFRIFSVYPKDNSRFPNTCTCKMSYFNLDDGTHSLNLIPCTLTMDLPASMDANNIARTKGTSGMWDLVSDRFYGNVANSGTFKAVNLAEGVDYEVHQWLKGDGTTYIDTLITSYSGIIKVGFKSTQSINCAIFGREASKSDYTDRLVLLRYYNNRYNVSDLYGIKTSGGYGIPTNLNDEELTIDLDNKIMTNKSGSYSIQINVGVNVTGFSVILFGRRLNESTVSAIAPSDVAIKNFSVSNQINLIPCKLLKPVPKWLDANGIARQAGECGMYDTVNDKFYGNVASSGTFSVSDDS